MDLFEQPGEAPTRPDVDEARCSYYDIYGTLTARTSTHKFTSDYYFPEEKRFIPIDQHMILSTCTDKLILELQTALVLSVSFHYEAWFLQLRPFTSHFLLENAGRQLVSPSALRTKSRLLFEHHRGEEE